MDDISYWTKYDMVCFHRSLNPDYDKSNTLIQVLNSLGVITVMDLDDYWLPTKEHPIHSIIVANKLHEKIINNLKVADYVTTTTKVFADEISKFNKNVVVFPNAINPKEPQFNEPTLISLAESGESNLQGIFLVKLVRNARASIHHIKLN